MSIDQCLTIYQLSVEAEKILSGKLETCRILTLRGLIRLEYMASELLLLRSCTVTSTSYNMILLNISQILIPGAKTSGCSSIKLETCRSQAFVFALLVLATPA